MLSIIFIWEKINYEFKFIFSSKLWYKIIPIIRFYFIRSLNKTRYCCICNRYSKNEILRNADFIREAMIELMTTNKEFIDSIENLFLVGRNGMHKYNNQDHSMLTAIQAVQNIKNGALSKENIWSINTEEEYHEEKK